MNKGGIPVFKESAKAYGLADDGLPYYMIRGSQISAAGAKVDATFKAAKIIIDGTGELVSDCIVNKNS